MNSDTESTIHSIDDSASGKNAYYVECAHQGQKVAYCACLNRQKTLASRDTGHPGDWSECKTAKSRNQCRALDMREQELLQGRALFFIPRNSLVRSQAASSGWKATDKILSGGIKTGELLVIAGGSGGRTAADVFFSIPRATYADAVTKAATAHAEAKPRAPGVAISGAKPAPAPAKTLHLIPGETPAQMVARLRAQAIAATQTPV